MKEIGIYDYEEYLKLFAKSLDYEKLRAGDSNEAKLLIDILKIKLGGEFKWYGDISKLHIRHFDADDFLLKIILRSFEPYVFIDRSVWTGNSMWFQFEE